MVATSNSASTRTTAPRTGLMTNSVIRYRLAKDAVQDGRQGARRQDVPDRRVALQAHHQVTSGPSQEEVVRQLDQVVDESHGQAHVKAGPQLDQQVGAQERGQEVVADDGADAEGEHEEKMMVATRDDLVDDERGEQG